MEDEKLTYKIRGCIYDVSKELGAGFLEQVYKNSLVQELTNAGLQCEAEKKITVQYKGKEVGLYTCHSGQAKREPESTFISHGMHGKKTKAKQKKVLICPCFPRLSVTKLT